MAFAPSSVFPSFATPGVNLAKLYFFIGCSSLYLDSIKLNFPYPTWYFPLSSFSLTAALLKLNDANLLGAK